MKRDGIWLLNSVFAISRTTRLCCGDTGRCTGRFSVSERLCLPSTSSSRGNCGLHWQPEIAFGAIVGDEFVLDERMTAELDLLADELEEITAREKADFRRQEQAFRKGEPALSVEGRSVLLVDDGLATGNTMLAAIRLRSEPEARESHRRGPGGFRRGLRRNPKGGGRVRVAWRRRAVLGGRRVVPRLRAGARCRGQGTSLQEPWQIRRLAAASAAIHVFRSGRVAETRRLVACGLP